MLTYRRCLLALLTVSLLLIALGCRPGTLTPTPTPTNPPIVPTEIEVANFALNEVVITGPSTDVDRVVAESGLDLQLISEVDLSYLANRDSQGSEELPEFSAADKVVVATLFDPKQYDTLVMRLYANPGDITSLLTTVETLNATASKLEITSYADPNYLTDPLGPGSCGDPYSGGGSPYSGGGSPYSGGGSPATFSAFATPQDAFQNQWAFTSDHGINLPSNENGFVIHDSVTGSGATVGVFDTSPWTGTGDQPVLSGSTLGTIAVHDSIATYRAGNVPPLINTRADIKEHGRFVAGLIKAIAPRSAVHLYRVLNDDGCGDLFVLSAALHEFIRENSPEGGGLANTVINLSLGVHVPDRIYHILPDGQNLPAQIAAMNTAIFEAYRLGAIVIAASGNDSAPNLPAQQMQLPAYYDRVLGVAASNISGNRSCFSNLGDVAAPGGDGDNSDPTHLCIPNTTGNLDLGIIGPFASGYGIWSGTSFSTPLVSALAALAFETSGGDRVQVLCRLQQGATPTSAPTLGWGILNIERSLNLTTCP